jgi:hypothetical protein
MKQTGEYVGRVEFHATRHSTIIVGFQLGANMTEKLHYATSSLQDFYAAPVNRVFSEFADPVARARRSAPTSEALVNDG